MNEVEEIVGYVYIKNGKIMGSDKTGKNIGLGRPFKITLPGYYRMVNGIPKMINSEKDLKPGDTFVGNRDFKNYYEKRIEAVGGEKLEDTRTHDELKNDEESNEEESSEQENDSEEESE